MKSFPEPLDVQKEKELLKIKDVSEKARELLILHNLRLVAHIVKKYGAMSIYDAEDLISTGIIGLIKAIDSFDDTKGNKLATYASRCIENEILMLLRASKRQSREVYLYDPVGVDKEGNTIQYMDILMHEDECVVDILDFAEQIEKLKYIFEHELSKREQDILKKRYGADDDREVTQRQIAEEYNISRSYVSRIEKKALKKLRAAYQK